MIERRAVETVIWGTPAVNFDRMYQAMVHDAKAGEGSNKIVYWSRLFDWKNQTLTPNPDSIYLMAFFNTKDIGPVVLEIPRADGGSITGSIDDCWQTAIEDVGSADVDKGNRRRFPAGSSGRYAEKQGCNTAATRVMHCCAPSSRAAVMPTSPRQSLAATESGFTSSARRLIRLKHNSSTQGTWYTMPLFPTTNDSSSRLTALCRSSPGRPGARRCL